MAGFFRFPGMNLQVWDFFLVYTGLVVPCDAYSTLSKENKVLELLVILSTQNRRIKFQKR